jgi:hypothetical protein
MRAVLRIDWRVQARGSFQSALTRSLRVDVGLVIGEQEEGIVIEQILDDRAEEFGVAVAECAARR